MSDGVEGATPYDLNARGACSKCGTPTLVAVTATGRYCSACLPTRALARLLSCLNRA